MYLLSATTKVVFVMNTFVNKMFFHWWKQALHNKRVIIQVICLKNRMIYQSELCWFSFRNFADDENSYRSKRLFKSFFVLLFSVWLCPLLAKALIENIKCNKHCQANYKTIVRRPKMPFPNVRQSTFSLFSLQ